MRLPQSWHGVHRLLVAFSNSDEPIDVETAGSTVLVSIDGVTHELPREAAMALRDSVSDALTERQAFFRTAGVHREDGSYVVERRNAESTGNATVFESFEELVRLFARLPEEFTAEELSKAGITGSRRHMLVRHFVEHPDFDCELVSRNPLEVRKAPESEPEVSAAAPAGAD